MVMKIAFEKSKPFHYNAKRHPWPTQITKPSRGITRKLTNKWTRLERVLNRRSYTEWFGNCRFLMLVNVDKLDKFRISAYNQRLIPLGFQMITVKHRDCCPVFDEMGLHPLSNALKSSHCITTPIIYAYGNALSPIGNLESVSLVQQVIKEFHGNKRKPTNYILAGAIDRQVLTQSQLLSIVDDYKQAPATYWAQLNGLLNLSAQIPSMLQVSQMQLINSLQYYATANASVINSDTDAAVDTTIAETEAATEDATSPTPTPTPTPTTTVVVDHDLETNE